MTGCNEKITGIRPTRDNGQVIFLPFLVLSSLSWTKEPDYSDTLIPLRAQAGTSLKNRLSKNNPSILIMKNNERKQ